MPVVPRARKTVTRREEFKFAVPFVLTPKRLLCRLSLAVAGAHQRNQACQTLQRH